MDVNATILFDNAPYVYIFLLCIAIALFTTASCFKKLFLASFYPINTNNNNNNNNNNNSNNNNNNSSYDNNNNN